MKKTALLIVLSPTGQGLSQALQTLDRRRHTAIVLVPSYDGEPWEAPEGVTIARPMDYLDADDTDALYARAFEWQKSMPAVEVHPGVRLHDWATSNGTPSALVSWLPGLFPYVHLRMRFIDTIQAAFVTEAPDAFMIVGSDPNFPWQASLARKAIAAVRPGAQEIGLEVETTTGAGLRDHVAWLLGHLRPAAETQHHQIVPETAPKRGSVTEASLIVRGQGDQTIIVAPDPGVTGVDIVSDLPANSSGAVNVRFEDGALRADVTLNADGVFLGRKRIAPRSQGSTALSLRMVEGTVTARVAEGPLVTLKAPVRSSIRRLTVEHQQKRGDVSIETAVSVFKSVAAEMSSPEEHREPPARPSAETALPPGATPKEHAAWASALERLELRLSELPPISGNRILLIMRGKRGLRWHHSATRGWVLTDMYVEGLPEALIEECRARGGRLTIIFEGHFPQYDAERRSYAERHPDVVDEIATSELSGLFAGGRATAIASAEQSAEKLLKSAIFRSAFSHSNVNYFDEIHEHLSGILTKQLSAFGSNYRAWSAILGRLRPSVVFGGRLESRPDINAAAHALNIRTVTIKLGIGEEMLPTFTNYTATGEFDHVSAPDTILVWGSYQADLLSKRFPEYKGNVVSCGRTRNDSFVQEIDNIDRNLVRRRLGLSDLEKVVIFGATSRTRYGLEGGAFYGASCMSPCSFENTLRAISGVAGKNGSTRVIVKPHPADDLDLIRKIITSIGDDAILLVTDSDGFHNNEMMAVADVFVSSVSSMLAEAALCGVPAVNIWLDDVNYLYERQRNTTYSTISTTCLSLPDLEVELHRLLRDSAHRAKSAERNIANIATLFGSISGQNALKAAVIGLRLADNSVASPLPETEFNAVAKLPSASEGPGLVFADVHVDASALLALLRRESRTGALVCVCANYATERTIREHASNDSSLQNIEVSKVVVADHRSVETAHLHARELGYAAAEFLKSIPPCGDDNVKFFEIIESLRDSISDTLNRYIRAAQCFRDLLLERDGITRAFVIGTGQFSSQRFAAALRTESADGVAWFMGRNDEIESLDSILDDIAETAAVPMRIPRPRRGAGPALAAPEEPLDVMLIASLRSGLYSHSLLPLINRMAQTHSLKIVGAGTPKGEQHHIQNDVADLGAALEFFQPTVKALSPGLEEVFQQAEAEILPYIRVHAPTCPASLREYAVSIGLNALPASYAYAEAVWESAEAHFQAGVGALLVSPGRLLEPRIFVRRAQHWGVGTLDFQFGTLSTSSKFLAPLADRVLAQDPGAFDILKEHFGVDQERLRLVGTPKTDQLLIDYGGLDRAAARQQLDIEDTVVPVVLFASQPFSGGVMAPILECLLEASRATPMRVIVKLHPAEGPDRAILYQQLIDRMGCADHVVLAPDGDTFAYIRACDVVTTYCSAIGMEAFALDRPVVTINPFDGDAPVDLHAMGLAGLARNSGQIASLIKGELGAPGFIADSLVDPQVARQRDLMRTVSDGKAIDRILAQVDEVMGAQSPATVATQPAP